MIIADTNEFHPLVDGQRYKNSTEADGSHHPIVIMRASYGTLKMDEKYVSSLREARQAGLLVGHYGYMVAGLDAATQGRFFANIVKSHGGVKDGDTIWCDDEEGTGNQAGRADAFLDAAHAVLHSPRDAEGIYSGYSFWKEHLGSVPVDGRLRWVAAYGQPDPHLPGEDLWQFTDKRVIPGVSGPCDASIFKGSAKDFIKMVTPAEQQGPFRHVVEHSDISIDKLAEKRNTSVDFIRDFSLQHLNDKNKAVFEAYMTLRAALHDAEAPRPAMPIGLVYWTVNA